MASYRTPFASCKSGMWDPDAWAAMVYSAVGHFFSALVNNMSAAHRTVIAALPLLPQATAATTVDLSWYAPNQTLINSLASAINGTGVYGFTFDSSSDPIGVAYGTYNWCNMPHARRQEYPAAASGYAITYAEVIHRHHKRTPYLSNTFPVEQYDWDCETSNLYYYAANPQYNTAPAQTYWEGFTDSSNPFNPGGFPGNCQFPQITGAGLHDSYKHGADLYGVYHDLLGLISDTACKTVSNSAPSNVTNEPITFRVTNNVITSEVAGYVIAGMCGPESRFPLLVQSNAVDSLEPRYSCGYASELLDSYGVGSNGSNWAAHLTDAALLFASLDAVPGISPDNSGWHVSFDRYFDTLSARLCHDKPLPCNVSDPTYCITQNEADQVFRLDEYEYSFIYRDSPESLTASTGSYGVWIAELSSHLRAMMNGDSSTVYRHNIAHDGSISRVLSILQVDVMVWPGMGSEVVFELYKLTDATKSAYWAQLNGQPLSIGKADSWFVRVLWGGRVLVSSSPTLGRMDMIPSSRLLAYFEGLIGQQASLIPALCAQ